MYWYVTIFQKSIFDLNTCTGIKIDNPDGNSKIFLAGISDGEPLGLIDNTMLGIPDYFQMGKELGFSIS